jgi:hypothetical protein
MTSRQVGRLSDEVTGERADEHAPAESDDERDRARREAEAERQDPADNEGRTGDEPPEERLAHQRTGSSGR